MKKIFLAFLIPLTFSSCVKTILQNVDLENDKKKIQGAWHLKKIEIITNQNNYYGLDFLDGDFGFNEDGTLGFITAAGEAYRGTWSVNIKETTTGCYTAPNGDQVCNTEWNHLLNLNVRQINAQKTKTASFESVTFQGDNNFKALIYVNYLTYMYYFERK